MSVNKANKDEIDLDLDTEYLEPNKVELDESKEDETINDSDINDNAVLILLSGLNQCYSNFLLL